MNILSEQNSLVGTWIGELRNTEVQKDSMRFRKNLERIGEVAAYEISKELAYDTVTVQTPMGTATCNQLKQQPVIATILRAGLPLHQGLLNYFSEADCAFVAAYRKHHRDGTFEIAQEYTTCPSLEGRTLILADPMFATGASLIISLDSLLENGNPQAIYIVAVLATKTGIALLERKYPQAKLIIGVVDEELTGRGFIVPGLGDAGDLAFGVKKQY